MERVSHNATRRRLDLLQIDLDRLRRAQDAARFTFVPPIDQNVILPEELVTQEEMRDLEGRLSDSLRQHQRMVVEQNMSRSALADLRRKLDEVREERDRLRATQDDINAENQDGHVEQDNDCPRQLRYIRAALSRMEEQRDKLIAADNELPEEREVDGPRVDFARLYWNLRESLEVLTEERDRLERVIRHANINDIQVEGEMNASVDAIEDECGNERVGLGTVVINYTRNMANARRERDEAREARDVADVARNDAVTSLAARDGKLWI